MAGRGVSKFDQTINLDDHDNSELTRAILPRTEEKYDRALRRFDKLDIGALPQPETGN